LVIVPYESAEGGLFWERPWFPGHGGQG
jgi:hypothetical protein